MATEQPKESLAAPLLAVNSEPWVQFEAVGHEKT